MEKLGFVGCGAMGSALIKGILESKVMQAENIICWDTDAQKLTALREQYNITAATHSRQVPEFADIIFLAVKPGDVPKVLAEFGERITEGHLLVSIAAGVTQAQIKRGLTSKAKVIRIMPNTPCLVGAGMIVIAPGKEVPDDGIEAVIKLLEPVGRVIVLAEKQLDAVTGLSGSGPAYVFAFIEALADGGVKAGLSKETALLLAAQTVLGAAKMMLETGEHPSVLKDRVTSPGGTTIEGLSVLEKGGFRGNIMGAVEAATRRSRELAGAGDAKQLK